MHRGKNHDTYKLILNPPDWSYRLEGKQQWLIRGRKKGKFNNEKSHNERRRMPSFTHKRESSGAGVDGRATVHTVRRGKECLMMINHTQLTRYLDLETSLR